MALLPTRSTNKNAPTNRSNTGDVFTSFQREMNHLMKNFLSDWNLDVSQINDFNFQPSIDLKEKGNKYLLDVDVPGLSESDIEIEFHNNILTLKGEKKSEKESKENDFICIERTSGSFRRDISLDEEIDEAHIKAELKDGVLHVELPKKDVNKSSHKKIPIRH